ncbi:MAG: carbohydrate ABC transporter permease [Tepidanaerobacteraceae bacterium]|nr:carbohydrate ABC transporter permease [Tepidanaerobacteraceae bacterium]
MKKRSLLIKILKVVVLGIFLVYTIFPFYWILITSFKSRQDIFTMPIQYWPKVFTLENYREIFEISNFGRYFMNSLIVSMVGAGGSLLAGLLGGYVLARFQFKGKTNILFLYLLTQMVPGFLILAPLYTLMSKLNLINKLGSLMVAYTAMLIPYCTISLRGFFQRIPESIEEAAMIDGCSRLYALFKVVTPVMLPGIAATYIFTFVQCWNEVFQAIMFIDIEANKTIPVALNSFIMKYDINWGALSAGTVISIIPTIILFGFIQKYMAAGLTDGAIKG